MLGWNDPEELGMGLSCPVLEGVLFRNGASYVCREHGSWFKACCQGWPFYLFLWAISIQLSCSQQQSLPALTWSLVPPACGSGQNGKRASLRVWLAEVTKTGTKTSLFCLNYIHPAIKMAVVVQCLLLGGGSPFGFFLLCKIVSYYLGFFQSFRLLFCV